MQHLTMLSLIISLLIVCNNKSYILVFWFLYSTVYALCYYCIIWRKSTLLPGGSKSLIRIQLVDDVFIAQSLRSSHPATLQIDLHANSGS